MNIYGGRRDRYNRTLAQNKASKSGLGSHAANTADTISNLHNLDPTSSPNPLQRYGLQIPPSSNQENNLIEKRSGKKQLFILLTISAFTLGVLIIVYYSDLYTFEQYGSEWNIIAMLMCIALAIWISTMTSAPPIKGMFVFLLYLIPIIITTIKLPVYGPGLLAFSMAISFIVFGF